MNSNGKHAQSLDEGALDRRDPGDAFLQNEIDTNRKSEFWLLGVTAIAGVFVAALIVIREVFFV